MQLAENLSRQYPKVGHSMGDAINSRTYHAISTFFQAMSNLVQALNRSMDWIVHHLPEYSASFLSGLTFIEILEDAEAFGFPLTDELYELYQWKNGAEREAPSMIFPTFEFLPLREVAKLIQQAEDDEMVQSLFTFGEQPLFPFMAHNGNYCAAIISRKSTMTSPVVSIGKQGGGSYIAFSSITTMMSGFAECFETGAYYLDENGYIDADSGRVASILRKHNPQLVEDALLNARTLLTDFQFTYESRMFISETLQALERFRPTEAVAILVEALPRYASAERRENLVVHSQISHTLQVIQQK